jgi:predicted DNA-binding transcriptional regulator AlpA
MRKSKRGHSDSARRPFPKPPRAVRPSAPVNVTGPITLLTKNAVLDILGVSHVTLWDWIRKGHFPPARVIGPDCGQRSKLVWIESEVRSAIANAPRRMPKGSTVTP